MLTGRLSGWWGVGCAALSHAGTISKAPGFPLVLGNNYFIFCSSSWVCPEPWRESAPHSLMWIPLCQAPRGDSLQSSEAKCTGSRDPQTERGTLSSCPKGFARALQKQQHHVGSEHPPLSCPGGWEAQKDVARLMSFHHWLVTRTPSLSPSCSSRELAAEAARTGLSCAWEGWQWSVNPLSRSQNALRAASNKKISPE